MKKHHILAAGLILLISLLLCAVTAAQADTPQPKKAAAQWSNEGFVVLSDSKYPENFIVLRKDISYLKEKTTGGGTVVNGNRFDLSNYDVVQKGVVQKGKDAYCIEAGGNLYFGVRDGASDANTLILKQDEMAVVDGITPQAALAVANYTLGAWIDWDPEFQIDDLKIKDIPFYFHGDVHFFLDHWSDSEENTTHHTIQCYFELNMDDMGFATDTETTTDDQHVPIFSYRGVKIIYVSMKLDHFKGDLGVGFSIHDGLKIHFDTWGVVPVSKISGERDGPRYDSQVTNVACHGDVEIGFEVGIGTKVEPIIQNQSLTIGFGYTIEGTDNNDRFVPADTKVKWHACDECWNEDVRDRIGPVNVVYDLVGFDPWTWSSDPYETDPFYNWYYSKTFDDYGGGECPHYSYRLDTTVVNQEYNPIPNVNIKWITNSRYQPQASGTTDNWGKAVIYVLPGNGQEITAEVASPIDPAKIIFQKKTITKKSDRDTLVFVLDIPEKHVYFRNSQTGEASSWPEDIAFMPFFSDYVQIPDTVPELSGRMFTGWNTKEDGSGTTYAPGTRLVLSDDLTLWAQWKLAGNEWHVIYNANGGTKAPAPGSFPLGTDGTVTTELPVAETMLFMGWTTDPFAAKVEYQPGDRLPYDSGKTYIVLYALWNLSPVPKPIHIAFNANGVQAAGLPRDIWLGRAGWIAVELASPPLDSNYYFKGWSKNPKAGEAEYLPGRHYFFDTDTTLYAVWSVSTEPIGTPITITFNANGGKPDSVSPPKNAPGKIWFRLRASDPEWDAQHDFLGWAPEPDAKVVVWKNGSLAMFEKDTTLYAVWRAHYKVIEGAGSTWTKGSDKTQRFVADGNIAYFTELRIDGKPFVDGVRIISGSTVADISPQAMETLSVGTHEVMFVYKDGEASAPFTVQGSLPLTGDRSTPLLWLLLVVFGLASTALAGIHLYAGGKAGCQKNEHQQEEEKA